MQAYVKTCHVCQVDKTERKKEAGLLQPLSIPEKPCQCVSMDFINGFPKVEGFGSGGGRQIFQVRCLYPSPE